MSEGFIPKGVVGSASQTPFHGTPNGGTWGGGTGLSGNEPANYTLARHITLTCHTCGNLLPLKLKKTHSELRRMCTDTNVSLEPQRRRAAGSVSSITEDK